MKTIIGRCADCKDGEITFVNIFTGKCEKHSPGKKKKQIRRVSVKMNVLLQLYKVEAKIFLGKNPNCVVCGDLASEIHHKAGRGVLLLEIDLWLSVCRNCHRRITDDSEWAEKNKYIIKRNSK